MWWPRIPAPRPTTWLPWRRMRIDVVGDEPVAAHDQVERGLALADAALAEQQHADAEHVDQHAVELVDGASRSAIHAGDRAR